MRAHGRHVARHLRRPAAKSAVQPSGMHRCRGDAPRGASRAGGPRRRTRRARRADVSPRSAASSTSPCRPSSSRPDCRSRSRAGQRAAPPARKRHQYGTWAIGAARKMRVRPWLEVAEPRCAPARTARRRRRTAPRRHADASAHAAAQPITPAPTTATRVMAQPRASSAGCRPVKPRARVPPRTVRCACCACKHCHLEGVDVPGGTSTSAIQSSRNGNSSGVTTTGPSEIAKSRAFVPSRSRATQSIDQREAADPALGVHDRRDAAHRGLDLRGAHGQHGRRRQGREDRGRSSRTRSRRPRRRAGWTADGARARGRRRRRAGIPRARAQARRR